MTIDNTLKILTECHADMGEHLSLCVKITLDEADDAIFNIVKNMGSTEHSVFFEAMREIRRKRTLVESGFVDKYINNYKTRLEKKQSRKTDTSGPGAGQGSSLDNSIKNIDEALAVTNTVNRIRRTCGTALSALDAPMKDLIPGSQDINKELYPASPEMFCTAFQEACEIIDINVEVKLILLKVFENTVVGKMDGIYADLEALVKEKMKAVSMQTNQRDLGKEQSLKSTLPSERANDHFIKASGEVRKQINLHIGNSIMPGFINDFLFNHWSKLLLKIYLRGGLESGNWLKAIEVVDDLVICVGGKSTMIAKKEFSPKIHYLVQRMKNGMNAIAVSPAIQSDLITKLMEYHKELINQGKKADTFNEDVTVPRFTQENKGVPFFNELLIDKK